MVPGLKRLIEEDALAGTRTVQLERYRLNDPRHVGPDGVVDGWRVELDSVLLWCDECNAERAHTPESDTKLFGFDARKVDLEFTCPQCKGKVWVAFMQAEVLKDEKEMQLVRWTKIAHWPAPIPVNRDLKRFLSDQWEYYRKGLYCERFGSGVGAAAYYRRIVENEIEALLDELGELAGDDFSHALAAVKNSRRGSERIAAVMDLLPESLRTEGENPLKLLYDHLSVDLHERSDSECLEMAHDVRVVLTYLVQEIRGRTERKRNAKKAITRLARHNARSREPQDT